MHPEPPTTQRISDTLYRMPLDVYRNLAELGVLGPSDQVKLLDGLLVKKRPKTPYHCYVINGTLKHFIDTLPEGWHPRCYNPIELPDGPWGDSVPEPDISILRGEVDAYPDRHPGPSDVALAIEVADLVPSLNQQSLIRYAWALAPVVWIVNLDRKEIEVHSRPSGPSENPGFARQQIFRQGPMPSLALGSQEFAAVAVELFLD